LQSAHCRGMKPITIKNEYGEIIEIKYDDDGVIKIRHSDIDPKSWGVLHEYNKRLRQTSLQDFLKKKGLDINDPMVSGMMKELAGRMGGYILLGKDTYQVNAEEVALIHAAVKQAGGIVPNWSSQP
jgi:hypothetical protein